MGASLRASGTAGTVQSTEQPPDSTSGTALRTGNQDAAPQVRRGRDAQAGDKALFFPAVVALQQQSCCPALMKFYFTTNFLRCFSLLPFLISFYLNHAAVIHSHLSSLFTFLSIQREKYLPRLQKVMTPSHQSFFLLWARSSSPISHAMLEATPA